MLIGYFSVDVPLEKAIASKKVLFDKKLINVEFANDANEVFYLDEYYLYVVATFASNEKKAFKVFNDQNALLFIDQTKEGHYIVSREEFTNEEKKRGFLDDFFGGSRKVEIEEDAEELFKIYDPSQNKWVMPLIIAAILVALIAGIYYLVQLTQPKPKPVIASVETNVTAAPLSQPEIWRLKRLSSLDLIVGINKEIHILLNDPLLEQRGRIKSVSISHVVTGDQLNSSAKVGLEFDFPVVDSLSIADNLYEKEIPFEIKKSRDGLKGISLNGTSFECIRQAVTIEDNKDGQVLVKERRDGQIKLHYQKIRPGYFITNLKGIMTSCPMYVDAISLVDGKFEIDTVIYPEKVF